MLNKLIQKLLTTVTFLSILGNGWLAYAARPVFPIQPAFDIGTRDEAYAKLFRLGRASEFETLLAIRVGAVDIDAIQVWLDGNNADFFSVVGTEFQHWAEGRFEKIRSATPTSSTEIRRVNWPGRPKQLQNSLATAPFNRAMPIGFYQAVSISPLNRYLSKSEQDPEIKVTKAETDDGVQLTAATENSKSVGDVTITQRQTGNARAMMSTGESLGSETTSVEIVEAVNKKERTSVRTEVTMAWQIQIAICPDVNGVIAGSGNISTTTKTTITTPQTIGILQRSVTIPVTIKGFVSDAAELTHYDIKGVATETVSGYERARRLDLINDSEFSDGTKKLVYDVLNNQPGKPTTSDTGQTKFIGEKLGDVRVTTVTDNVSQTDAFRIDKTAGANIAWIFLQANLFFKSARSNWRYGECVELTLTAPKSVLRPSEHINITAETVHKYDKTKVNAELRVRSSTESVSPESQSGTPQAVFDLTAPPKGKTGFISIDSVSKRGIALEIKHFEEEKLRPKPVPPVNAPPVTACSGGWSGKITTVKSKRSEIVKPINGRLIRQLERREEVVSIDYHVLGIEDRSQGFNNGFFSNAQLNFRSSEYRESNYAAGQMSCGNTIVTTPQTQIFENLMTAISSKRITVYISVGGRMGIFSFASPEIHAERVITRKYESACPSYNEKNSGVDRDSRLLEVPNPEFEIEFEIGPRGDRQLEGSKTIQNSDGSETRVTWNLTRNCK